MNYIAGEWSASGGGCTYERENPAVPHRVIGEYPESTPADGRRAADAARRAFGAWSGAPAAERTEILVRAADLILRRQTEIAAALTAEEGKPIGRARGEVARAAEALKYFAHGALRSGGQTMQSLRPGVRLATWREPIGPFLAITPFNFPLFIAALKLGPAMASGNTMVWKPSPHTPVVSVELMQAFVDAGLPGGVLNLVMGGSAELGQSLVEDPDIVGVSFTGSTAVGLDIGSRGAARHIRVQQEMGGKNVLVVADDCDLKRAAEVAAESSFGESGQKCTAAGLVVVDRRRGEEFLAEVESILKAMTLGDGADSGTDLGPLVDRTALHRANDLYDRAIDAGAVSELSGCGTSAADADGYFFEPRVVRLPQGEHLLKTQEAFAPILSLVLADDVVDEGLSLVSQCGMGLSASILTDSLSAADDFSRRVSAGLVNVNLPTTGVEYQAAFGGWNLSGGPFPEGGAGAEEFYVRTKTVATASRL